MGKFQIIQPSTRAFAEEGRRTKGYTLFNFLHGYFYGRWPYLYIGMGTGAHPLAKYLKPVIGWIGTLLIPKPTPDQVAPAIKFEDTYHGKVVPLATSRQLVSVKQDIRIPDLEKVIPYSLARAIILQHPDHIVVLDCPCRVNREHPCLPLDVCLIIGEPFASFVSEHHPTKTRWITSEEAQAILEAEDARGHAHHAFFKDAMLGRFYAICNCCSCCCGAMQAQQQGVQMLASSGYVAEVDEALCIACGTCESLCPFGAIAVDLAAVVDIDKCMGCGICMNNCDQQAAILVRNESKGIPLELV